MYFLFWIIVGLIMGWVTRKLLKEGGYGPIVDLAMCIAGAVAGGFIVRVASLPGHAGLVYSTLATILGAVILRGLTGYVSGRRRYAPNIAKPPSGDAAPNAHAEANLRL